ncbi:MAG: hypothetical protein ACE5IH_06320 [Thermodesulfobacteriota bacterium]
METIEDIHGFIQGIIDTYEMRVKTIGQLMIEALGLVENYRREQEDMINRLKDNLARTECLRRKDFDTMMEKIKVFSKEREEDARDALKNFCSEGAKVVEILRDMFSEGRAVSLKDFIDMKAGIFAYHIGREKEVTKLLKELHREQEELNVALKRLLSKGGDIKIKDLKAVKKAFQIQHMGKESEVNRILDDFSKVWQGVTTQWQGLISAYEGEGNSY